MLLWLAGCFLLDQEPTIEAFDVQTDACGRWTATIEATGDGDVVELLVDGVPSGSWTVTGDQTLTGQGVAVPGRGIVLQARAGTAQEFRTAQMPPLDALVSVSPPRGVFAPGAPPELAIQVATACPMDQFRLTWTLRPGDLTQQLIIPRNGGKIMLPALERGRYELTVELAAGNVPVTQQIVELYIGNPDDDLDRDGHKGGLDGTDCDDLNPRVHPMMAEAAIANQIDDNCDGIVDEGTSAYDDDGDGLSEDAGDCDDRDPQRFPGAPEVADCRDQDCDGEVDEGVTLVQVDDRYEPNDAASKAWDLQTSRQRRFVETLTVVTRDADDEAWFTFYSQDGDWDDWGIDVTIERLPAGAVYDVEVYDGGSGPRRTGRIAAEGEAVTVRGKVFKDDSGNYELLIKPVHVEQAWCPVTIRILSR